MKNIRFGTFTSVWDDGFEVVTNAELDEETGEVTADCVDTDDLDLDILDREYFTDVEGVEHEVCTECHEYIMRDKMIEGEGNGIDYDGQQICSNPYCFSNCL
jgi:hypothetical protein